MTSMPSPVPDDVEAERLKLEYRLAQLQTQERAKTHFLDFVRYVWPDAILGEHHRRIADVFDRVANGTLKRVIINLAPRHTKSELASYLLPAFLMGRDPRTKAIEATHTAELAVRFGRKVRDLMDQPGYKELFPDVSLKQDSKAAGRWDTNRGGEYFAVGVGGAMTGRGADILIIDDPHSEADALSELALDNAWEWYQSGPRTRLQPGGAVVVVMCMTGDTPVLMASGVEKALRDIRPGDQVATFDQGRLSVSQVNNWRSSGVDPIYRIRTLSGRIVRANERHPFLVSDEGKLRWTRLKHLRVGDSLVSLKDATGLQGPPQGRANADHAKQTTAITENTRMPRIGGWGFTASGKVSHAVKKAVTRLQYHAGSALRIISRSTRLRSPLKPPESIESRTGTELPLSNMRQWSESETTFATYAEGFLTAVTPVHTGTGNFALTTATTLKRSGGYFATTATLPSDMEKHRTTSKGLPVTCDFTTDPIVSIEPDGEEEVFDVEVDRTENFIANGLVSHNTRWGTKDLTARLIKAQSSHNADKWEVIELPAILPSGKPLWPEFWKLEELLAVKASLSVQKWNAMYQQQPTNDEGAILKREWWRVWQEAEPPLVNYIIQTMDTAYSKKETADFSVITTWGVFYLNEDSGANIILLDVKRGRWDFPELKRVAKEQYDHWQPDNLLIEAKATGTPLQQELRRMNIPVTMYSPGGRKAGTDKVSRANSVAPILESGIVWAPDTDWAEELVEECAAFPHGDNDDMVDVTTMALMRFRQGNFISLQTDDNTDSSGHRDLVPEYY